MRTGALRTAGIVMALLWLGVGVAMAQETGLTADPAGPSEVDSEWGGGPDGGTLAAGEAGGGAYGGYDPYDPYDPYNPYCPYDPYDPYDSYPDFILVPQDYPTIQQAINAACHDDTVLVDDGVYAGTGNRDIRLYGKNITVRSRNGSGATILDLSGAPDHRAFVFDSGETFYTVVEGFTMRGGDSSSGGGAVLAIGAYPRFRSCVFEDNRALHGGAVYMSNASSGCSFVDCSFLRNAATYDGGAMMMVGISTVSFHGCRYEDNAAGWRGGALYVSGSAGVGGGVSSASLVRTSLLRNRAGTDGGAIHLWQGAAHLQACLLAGNIAGQDGGGIRSTYGGHVFLSRVTASGNSAGRSGGVLASLNDSEVSVGGAILWGNTASVSAPSMLVMGSPSLQVTYSHVQGGWSGTGNSAADPMFMSPATGNYRLRSFSSCIDSGLPVGGVWDLESNPWYDDPGVANTGGSNPPYADRGCYERQTPSTRRFIEAETQ